MSHHFCRWYFNKGESSGSGDISGISIPMEKILGMIRGLCLGSLDPTKLIYSFKKKVNKQGIGSPNLTLLHPLSKLLSLIPNRQV